MSWSIRRRLALIYMDIVRNKSTRPRERMAAADAAGRWLERDEIAKGLPMSPEELAEVDESGILLGLRPRMPGKSEKSGKASG